MSLCSKSRLAGLASRLSCSVLIISSHAGRADRGCILAAVLPDAAVLAASRARAVLIGSRNAIKAFRLAGLRLVITSDAAAALKGAIAGRVSPNRAVRALTYALSVVVLAGLAQRARGRARLPAVGGRGAVNTSCSCGDVNKLARIAERADRGAFNVGEASQAAILASRCARVVLIIAFGALLALTGAIVGGEMAAGASNALSLAAHVNVKSFQTWVAIALASFWLHFASLTGKAGRGRRGVGEGARAASQAAGSARQGGIKTRAAYAARG